MTITFLGQGYEPNSNDAIGNHLINFFGKEEFHTFTGISAFASEAGIIGLAENIQKAKQFFREIKIIVGIDQEGTSREALYEINNLEVNGYIFHQKEAPIFHPKIYLFEGDLNVKIIVGSSNLTARGLFANVEGSLLIEFDKADKEGNQLLQKLKSYYEGIFDLTDPNLFEINAGNIEAFIAKGLVPLEKDRNRKYGKKPYKKQEEGDHKELDIDIPKRETGKIPIAFRARPRNNPVLAKVVEELELEDNIEQMRILIWRKEQLSNSDAQKVPAGTAPTGNLKLSQARFRFNGEYINHVTYFKDGVFYNLEWVKTKADSETYEEAFCRFHVIMLGMDLGIHAIKLSHDSVRVAGQGNTPTWLHWGHYLSIHLQEIDVSGRTLFLYKQEIEPYFSIEIV